MAVVRSVAFQNARKSVGQTSFYRRKGVQMVKSKPTFVPGRTFTNAQLKQQQNFKCIKYFLTELEGYSYADHCNAGAKKSYNSSTRYNHLVGNILKELSKIGPNLNTDYVLWCQYNFLSATFFFSIGNLPTPFVTKCEITKDDEFPYIYLSFKRADIDAILRKANRQYRGNFQYTYRHFGGCGFFKNNDFRGRDYQLVPEMMKYYDGGDIVKLGYRVMLPIPMADLNPFWGMFSLFLNRINTRLYPETPSLFNTSVFMIEKFTLW